MLAFKSHYTGGYVDNQRSPLNIPYKPFLAPLYTFGTEGEICYWQTKNSSVIEQYASFLSDNEKKDIGLHIFHWSLLIVRWNEITINPIAVRSKVSYYLICNEVSLKMNSIQVDNISSSKLGIDFSSAWNINISINISK